MSATPSDGYDVGSPVSLGPAAVQNSLPTAPIVYIDPQEPITEFDDLQCVIDTPSQDADGDTITYSFVWTKNGVLYTGSTQSTDEPGDTIPIASTLSNEMWSVSDNDGSHDEKGPDRDCTNAHDDSKKETSTVRTPRTSTARTNLTSGKSPQRAAVESDAR